MITVIHILYEIFAIDMLTALKHSLEYDRKRVLLLLRLWRPSFSRGLNASKNNDTERSFKALSLRRRDATKFE